MLVLRLQLVYQRLEFEGFLHSFHLPLVQRRKVGELRRQIIGRLQPLLERGKARARLPEIVFIAAQRVTAHVKPGLPGGVMHVIGSAHFWRTLDGHVIREARRQFDAPDGQAAKHGYQHNQGAEGQSESGTQG